MTETFSNRQYEWGGVVGVGTEWAWTSNWTVTSEFLYMRFANKRESTFPPAFAANNASPIANPSPSRSGADGTYRPELSSAIRWLRSTDLSEASRFESARPSGLFALNAPQPDHRFADAK